MKNKKNHVILSTAEKADAYVHRKEETMMNTIILFAYLESENHAALDRKQGLYFVHSYKIKQGELLS